MASLKITRNEGESWLQCALRYAKKYGVELEVQDAYNEHIASGSDEAEAAFDACYDWDICELAE